MADPAGSFRTNHMWLFRCRDCRSLLVAHGVRDDRCETLWKYGVQPEREFGGAVARFVHAVGEPKHSVADFEACDAFADFDDLAC
jgi:hypothetical protein